MKKKGIFSLLEDCDGRQQSRKNELEPVHRYKAKNGKTEVLISKPKANPKIAKSKHVRADYYDNNEAISLTFVNGSYRYQPDSAGSYTQQQSYESNPFTEEMDYFVEPFDSPKSSDMMVGFKNPPATAAPPQAPPKKKTDIPGTETTVHSAYPTAEGSKKKPDSSEEVTKTKPVLDEDAAFAEDIKAILSGKKTYDQHQKKMVPPEEVRRHRPDPTPTPKPKPEAKELINEHAIFDKIAQSMQLATSYDLGSIDLDQRFDTFDKDVDKKENEISPDKQRSVPSVDEQNANRGKQEEEIKNEEIPPLDTLDFLTELDKIKKSKIPRTIFPKAPHDSIPDPDISQFPIVDPKEPQNPIDENISNKPKPKPIDSGGGTQLPVDSTIKQKPSDQFFEKYYSAIDKSKEGTNNEAVILEAMVIGADGEVLFDSSNSMHVKFGVGDWEDYPEQEGILEIYANDQEDIYTSDFLD